MKSEIPSKWLVYIIPGMIVVASIIIFLGKHQYHILNWIYNYQTLSILFFPIVGYIVGLTLDMFLIIVIKPILVIIKNEWPRLFCWISLDTDDVPDISGDFKIHQHASPAVLEVLTYCYQIMVFYRLMVTSLAIFLIALLGIIHHPHTCWYIVLGIIISIILFIKAWWKARTYYHQYAEHIKGINY
jgi:hypothetical protein